MIFLWSPLNLIDIKSPTDLKGLSLAELTDLTAQARQALMTKVSEHGGHVGPPMGAAEMIMINPLQKIMVVCIVVFANCASLMVKVLTIFSSL